MCWILCESIVMGGSALQWRTSVPVPSLFLTISLTLCKLFNFSEPWLPSVENRGNEPFLKAIVKMKWDEIHIESGNYMGQVYSEWLLSLLQRRRVPHPSLRERSGWCLCGAEELGWALKGELGWAGKGETCKILLWVSPLVMHYGAGDLWEDTFPSFPLGVRAWQWGSAIGIFVAIWPWESE